MVCTKHLINDGNDDDDDGAWLEDRKVVCYQVSNNLYKKIFLI